MRETIKHLLGDPVDMSALIKSLLIVTLAVAAVSYRFIDEECLGCGRRECPMGISKPMRTMSIVEWMYDTQTDGDLHTNGVCPTSYTIYIIKGN